MKRRISAMFKQKTRRMGALITLTALAITAIFPSFAALALEDSATAQPYSDEYTLRGGDSADDILHDIFALALTRVGDGQGDHPLRAGRVLASGSQRRFRHGRRADGRRSRAGSMGRGYIARRARGLFGKQAAYG